MKLIIKLWQFIKSRGRIRKVKDTVGFLEKCEYYQTDIQLLFDNEVFELTNGSAVIHKDYEGRVRQININKRAWKE